MSIKKKRDNSLTAAWVAPQVGLLSEDMWKEMKEIASLCVRMTSLTKLKLETQKPRVTYI